jgi:hypothetical protein
VTTAVSVVIALWSPPSAMGTSLPRAVLFANRLFDHNERRGFAA